MIKKIEKIFKKVFYDNKKKLNPYIINYYENLEGNDLKIAFDNVKRDIKNTNEIINFFYRLLQNINVNNKVKSYINNEVIKDLKYHNETNNEIIKLIKKRGNYKMYEYLINVKLKKQDGYFKEKGYYTEADSSEEAIKNAIEFFIDEENNSNEVPVNLTEIEVKIVSYSEIDSDIEEEEDENLYDEEDENLEQDTDEELSYNITIKPIHNQKELENIYEE